jgi:hypothetical protein
MKMAQEYRSIFDEMIKKPAPTGDPKTAMGRLQNNFRDHDFNTGNQRIKARYYGQPPTDLTPAQVKALESAERNYRIASIEFGKPREDVRAWDNMPISPGLPPKQPVLGLDWSIAVGRAEKGFVRKSLAKQIITSILNREHPASHAYFDATHPQHADVVANVFSVREIMNSDD